MSVFTCVRNCSLVYARICARTCVCVCMCVCVCVCVLRRLRVAACGGEERNRGRIWVKPFSSSLSPRRLYLIFSFLALSRSRSIMRSQRYNTRTLAETDVHETRRVSVSSIITIRDSYSRIDMFGHLRFSSLALYAWIFSTLVVRKKNPFQRNYRT